MKNQTNWQNELKSLLRSPQQLADFLGISIKKWPQVWENNTSFPLLLTRHFAKKIDPENNSDPLLLQILPTKSENTLQNNFCSDPVGDLNAVQKPGILQKYHGRALIMPTATCALNCRHCFRRNFPYADQKANNLPQNLKEWLQNQANISEIILSGGDPLLASNQQLAEIFKVLKDSSVKKVRIHTRLVTVLPQRFDQNFWKTLDILPQKIILVNHINHAQELDADSLTIFGKMREKGIFLLNQSVLLKGINDNSKVLAELSEALLSQGVLPYYLHQLDRAQGTQGFEVDTTTALKIMDKLRQILPGYLVPKFVQEVAGLAYKQPLF
ncbi:MAG: KamA family radical SAM protein [Fibrobacter sp.]|nr:KamA family radical SAM protein [Fibrobacter sp.]